MKTTAIDLVKKEREKQISKHGYTTAHDRQHPKKAVLYGALAYLNSVIYSPTVGTEDWPFEEESFKPEGDIKNLVKAAAMIIAEIDKRLEEC